MFYQSNNLVLCLIPQKNGEEPCSHHPPPPISHPWGLGGTLRRTAGHLRANHPTARPFPRDAPRSVPNPHCQLRTSIELQTVPRRDHMCVRLCLSLSQVVPMLDTGHPSEACTRGARDAPRREPTPYARAPPPPSPLPPQAPPPLRSMWLGALAAAGGAAAAALRHLRSPRPHVLATRCLDIVLQHPTRLLCAVTPVFRRLSARDDSEPKNTHGSFMLSIFYVDVDEFQPTVWG